MPLHDQNSWRREKFGNARFSRLKRRNLDAMHVGLDRALRNAELLGRLVIGHFAPFAWKKLFRRIKPLRFSLGHILLAHARANPFHKRHCPTQFVENVSRQGVGRFEQVKLLRLDCVEMEVRRSGPAFLGASAMPFVGQEMLEGGKQERTKLSAFALRRLELPLFQKFREERLGQVFRVLRIAA